MEVSIDRDKSAPFLRIRSSVTSIAIDMKYLSRSKYAVKADGYLIPEADIECPPPTLDDGQPLLVHNADIL